ncbi:MAG: bifunctional DNA-formamidopyrimidine glycosylase/DNA-(apurinic or apyrimidinic site) lyase [Anaerolineales bacterium]
MPELPEVESFATRFRNGTPEHPSLVGWCIQSAQIFWARSVAQPTPTAFEQQIAGQCIQAVGRRGKYLLLQLSRDMLIIHLRMSGDLFVQRGQAQEISHIRAEFSFNNGWRLLFRDDRKFGRLWLVENPDSVVGNLGPEPLEAAFTPEWLHTQLTARSRLVKPLLLDQHFIAGLGNIYTDEALHRARIHPLRRSDTLTAAESETLWRAVRLVLHAGIAANGASIDWVYRGGGFQNEFLVYGRGGLPCQTCGTLIEKIVVGQRGTHICPVCQPLVRI